MKKLMFCLIFLPLITFAELVKINDWVVNTEIDPITDEKKVSIMVGDTTKKSLNQSAGLILDCKSITLVSMKLTDAPKKNEVGDATKIILRVDKNKPIETVWEKIDVGYEFTDFNEINNLIANGKKLVVRAEYSSETKDFIFSLSGFSKAYDQLKKNCSID